MNCEMAAKSSIHWRIFASHLSGFLTMRTACRIFTNKLTTHLTSPGRNTTMVTNTGMKALMPKPTQPHTKTVVRIASSGMAESCGTPQAHHQRRHEGKAEHVDAVLDHGDGGGRRGGDALVVHVVDLHGLPARRKGGDALVKLAHQRHLRSLAEGQRIAARLAQNGEFERFHHEHDDEQRRHGATAATSSCRASPRQRWRRHPRRAFG